MNATVMERTRVNFSQNVEDFETYLANKAAVDADYADFQSYVIDRIPTPNKK